MMGFFKSKTQNKINWTPLNSENQIDDLIELSNQRPVAIFKHSTRCSISSMAMSRLERGFNLTAESVEMYYLDLISYRNISNEIARLLSVEHQSPQLILILAGKAVYHTSHNEISPEVFIEKINEIYPGK